jgi:molybdopterin-guanine dinucleotide biosynthesis protein A
MPPPAPPHPGDARIPGVILAGGRATRMGGGDKGLRLLGGQTLLAHVIARLAAQCGPLAISANGDPARMSGFGLPVLPDGLPVLPDGLPDFPGPLAGILAGLDWAATFGAPAIVTAAADTPFLPADLVARLTAAAGPAGLALAASPDADGTVQRHPTFGLWPVALRHDLRAALQGGLRKITRWADSHQAGTAVFSAGPFDPFFNVNTPDDLARADRHLHPQRVWGVTGWKNTGKTGLTERLVAYLTAQGLSLSTIKHAHHDADVDRPGTDSFRHRAAGAREVILSTPRRWALMHEPADGTEPPLAAHLARLSPVDLVLVEGYKSAPHPKIETHRPEAGQPLIAPADPMIRAVASTAAHPGLSLPVFHLDDTAAIAAFIRAEVGL